MRILFIIAIETRCQNRKGEILFLLKFEYPYVGVLVINYKLSKNELSIQSDLPI